jgi:iron(III) transport system ATP-binding protein
MAGELLSSPDVSVPPQQRRIGFVFQSLGLWPHLTVNGHLDFVLQAAPMTKAERLARRAEMLDVFVLGGLENRYPSELSGGERHLLAIARAFCNDIRLLILDEPFTGLDGALKQRLLETLRRERGRRGLTTLLVTHDDEEMRMLCDRIEHLSEGRIMERLKEQPR